MKENCIWGPVSPESDEILERQVGGVTIWVRELGDEWLIAHEYHTMTGRRELEHRSGVTDLKWVRIVSTGSDQVSAQPALPDRPVVIRPLAPIVILPGRWGRFFFSVPLWVRFVSRTGEQEQTMTEVATQPLSSSWFGDMETGQLCYSVGSRLLRAVPETDDDDAFARCEVEIRNGSRERLEFARICVHVEHMHLYLADGKFWSNQVRVVFKGSEQVSQISYRPGPPHPHTGAEAVSEPREAEDRNLLKRSFNLIREITGI